MGLNHSMQHMEWSKVVGMVMDMAGSTVVDTSIRQRLHVEGNILEVTVLRQWQWQRHQCGSRHCHQNWAGLE